MTKNELIVESCRNMAFQDLRDTLSDALDNRDATIAALRAESSSMQATVRKLTDIAEQQSAELTQLREDRRVLNTEATFARKLFEAAEREAGDDRSMQTQREYDLAYTAYMAVRKDTDSSGAIGRAT